jgi:hypothetical protein
MERWRWVETGRVEEGNEEYEGSVRRGSVGFSSSITKCRECF